MNLNLAFQKLMRTIRNRVWFLRGKPTPSPRPTLAALLGQPEPAVPPAMLDIAALLRKNGITPRGVIHVGAHQAGELDDYLRMGFTKILYVEANPALIPGLLAKAQAHSGKVIIVHAAASDVDGTVRLRVTSMDQSSSILPLAKHKDIYPSIREVSQVEVRSRSLDTLLAEEGLRAEDFNFLNLDIQGAELMALRGASGLLGKIEAVNTEVNLQELYEGAALLGELENFMAKLGFNRVAMVTPWHPSWGDAFYVRKPVVMMTTFGTNGRFANQLFQYMFLHLVARRQGALVQVPRWAGCELFGCDDPEPLLTLPEWRESADGPNGRAALLDRDWVRHFRETDPAFVSTDYSGYFMGHSRDLAPDREFIRGLFRFQPAFIESAGRRLAKLRAHRRRILAVHLRRGDYGDGYFFRAPLRMVRGLASSKRPGSRGMGHLHLLGEAGRISRAFRRVQNRRRLRFERHRQPGHLSRLLRHDAGGQGPDREQLLLFRGRDAERERHGVPSSMRREGMPCSFRSMGRRGPAPLRCLARSPSAVLESRLTAPRAPRHDSNPLRATSAESRWISWLFHRCAPPGWLGQPTLPSCRRPRSVDGHRG